MNITQKVYKIIFDALEKNREGLQWSELLKIIKEKDPTIHPKTANGLVWKMLEKYPDEVYKPKKGCFRLTKYK